VPLEAEDAVLVSRAARGEGAAFAELTQRQGRPVVALLRRLLGRPEDGRLIACRRDNARLWGHAGCRVFADRALWDEHPPDAQRLVVDGVPFVHWHDCLGRLAVGVVPGDYVISSS